MRTADIAWLAGLYEGEGCFGLHRGRARATPAEYVNLSMTDRDVIERVGALLGKKVNGPYQQNGHKPQYRVTLWSIAARGLMMTLFSLLGERRRAKIKEILEVKQ